MPDDGLAAFLMAIDEALAVQAAVGETLDLYLLGRSALVLGYGFGLMTKDVDVLSKHCSPLLGMALERFGRGSPGARTLGFYLEDVPGGLPPVPIGFEARCSPINGPWRVLRPRRPEPHDLVITKLRRFHLGDREDIRLLCDTESLDSSTLRERFDLAHAFSDRDDPSVVRASENLERVVAYLDGRTHAL